MLPTSIVNFSIADRGWLPYSENS